MFKKYTMLFSLLSFSLMFAEANESMTRACNQNVNCCTPTPIQCCLVAGRIGTAVSDDGSLIFPTIGNCFTASVISQDAAGRASVISVRFNKPFCSNVAVTAWADSNVADCSAAQGPSVRLFTPSPSCGGFLLQAPLLEDGVTVDPSVTSISFIATPCT